MALGRRSDGERKEEKIFDEPLAKYRERKLEIKVNSETSELILHMYLLDFIIYTNKNAPSLPTDICNEVNPLSYDI
jgi:hypothetical protein